MAFKIQQPTRNAIQVLNMLLDVCATFETGLMQRPEFPTATLESVTESFQTKLNHVRSQLPSGTDITKAIVAPDVTQVKFTDRETEVTTADKKQKRKSAKEKRTDAKVANDERSAATENTFLHARIDALQNQMQHSLQTIKDDYDKQLYEFKLTISVIKANYLDKDTKLSATDVSSQVLDGVAGDGRIKINKLCDDIELLINNVEQLVKKIAAYIGSMTTKTVMPADVGTCTPNPAYKLADFIIDINTVFEIIMTMMGYLNRIKDNIGQLRLSDAKNIHKKLIKLNLDDLFKFSPTDIQSVETEVATIEQSVTEMKSLADDATRTVKVAMSKRYTTVYENMEEGTGDILYYKRPVFLLPDDPADMTLRGWNLYYAGEKFKEISATNWAKLDVQSRNKYGTTNSKSINAYCKAQLNEMKSKASGAMDRDDRVWYAFIETDNINGGNNYETAKTISSPKIQGTVINSNISGLPGCIIELDNGKKYVVDSIPLPGSIIKLPTGEYVSIK